MSPTTFIHYARVVLIAALLSPIGGHATALTLPDFPLFLTSVGVPPNLVMTIDNSGSMARSWMPDDVDSFMNTTDLRDSHLPQSMVCTITQESPISSRLEAMASVIQLALTTLGSMALTRARGQLI